jgi:hypothetical protein
MMSLLISDLDFIQGNSNSRSITGAALRTITPGLSTSISTDLDTKMLTYLNVDATPDQITIVQIALASGAGAGAAAAAVKGRAYAIARATA